MGRRERLTWESRRASTPPATPNEGVTHPAGYADPPADSWTTGDPSSWGEDVHPGPYAKGAPPAVPHEDDGYQHPAARVASMRKAANRKASTCVKLAMSMLGSKVAAAAEEGDEDAEEMVAASALDLMDLPEARLASMLRRVDACTLPLAELRRRMGGEDEAESEHDETEAKASKKASRRRAEEEEDEAEKESSKKASRRRAKDDEEDDKLPAFLKEKEKEKESSKKKASFQDRLAEIEGLLASLRSSADDEEEEDEGATAGCGAYGAEDEDEALLDQMAAELDAGAGAWDEGASLEEDVALVDDGEDFGFFGDDAGVAMDEFEGGDDDLMSLYGGRMAAEEEEKKEGEEAKESSKKASARPRPQAPRPQAGPRSLGSVRAAAASPSADLSNLWASAPDVSDIFNT